MTGPGSFTPEWVMVGRRIDGGRYRLQASRELPGAEFGLKEANWASEWTLNAVMKQMITVDGESYGDCLAQLMIIWRDLGQREVAATERKTLLGRKMLPAAEGPPYTTGPAS